MDELLWLGCAPSGAAAGRPCGAARRSQSAGDDQPSGGARRDRTDDLMLAKHALSQLSYSPLGECKAFADSATAHSQSEWAKAPASSGKATTPCNGGPGRTRTSDLTLIKRAL